MIPIACPRDAGLLGRRDGARMYRPERSRLEAWIEAHRYRVAPGTSDLTLSVYRFAFHEGWSAAAAEAAHKTKE